MRKNKFCFIYLWKSGNSIKWGQDSRLGIWEYDFIPILSFEVALLLFYNFFFVVYWKKKLRAPVIMVGFWVFLIPWNANIWNRKIWINIFNLEKKLFSVSQKTFDVIKWVLLGQFLRKETVLPVWKNKVMNHNVQSTVLIYACCHFDEELKYVKLILKTSLRNIVWRWFRFS